MHRSPDAPIVRLRWVYADGPFVLPDGYTVINNRVWNSDDQRELTVGQLPFLQSDYVQDERFRLPAFAFDGHQCNPQWFVSGEPWPISPDLQPTIPLAGWIPACCVMPCVNEDCKSEPVNLEPASQSIQYPIPATSADGTTSAYQLTVASALAVGGGLWPGTLEEWFGEGLDGTSQYSLQNLTRPDGTPFNRVERFTIDADNTFERTQDEDGITWTMRHHGTDFSMVLRDLAGQGQLSGSNLVIAPSILPPDVSYRVTSTVQPVGMTKAGSPTITNGVWHIFDGGPGNKALQLAEAPGVIIDLTTDGIAGLLIFPPTGENIGLGALNAPFTPALPFGTATVVRFIRFDGPGVTFPQWGVEYYSRAAFVPTAGTVTSVGISTTSAGVSVGGGPITAAGTLTVDLDSALNDLVAVSFTTDLFTGDGAGGWQAVTIGDYLSFAGGVLDVVPPTAENGQLVCTAFTITGATGVWQATGNTISLPSAGTYLITGQIRGALVSGAAGNHTIQVRLNDNTAGAAVANSEVLCGFVVASGAFDSDTNALTAIVTVAVASTIELYARRTGTVWTQSVIQSSSDGYTKLAWVKLNS